MYDNYCNAATYFTAKQLMHLNVFVYATAELGRNTHATAELERSATAAATAELERNTRARTALGPRRVYTVQTQKNISAGA